MLGPPPPDRDMGVFETMLVYDGHPIELDAHLKRMSASLKVLFGSALPPDSRRLALERAHGINLGRLRLTVAPGTGGDLRAQVRAARIEPALVFPAPERALTLASHVIEGGLGAHKWSDRRSLQSAEAGVRTGSVLLIIEPNGEVLEASRANVFWVRGGVLFTPARDGRILAGIARLGAIEVAHEAGIEVHEETAALDSLAQADEVFLTGSVRGVEPVSSLDGVERPAAGALSAQIAAGLWRRWRDPSGSGFAPAPQGAPPPGRLAP